ncbi:MAG: hypothetical protein ACR2O4_16225 [Hyphomicrobiaceae bacterium]
MAHVTERLHHTGSLPSESNWMETVGSWIRSRIENHARKQDIRRLLGYSDRLLEDMGLTRYELVEELGYDPGELPAMYRLGTYRMPHL